MAEQWRILVVEDEEKLNGNIVSSLRKDGYGVLGVTGGGEAIRTLWGEKYDVVICNQQMADADGFDLLQWMRTYCPDARMVMLGAPADGVGRTQALEMGVASYLEKPLDMHELKEELRRLLHQTGFSASLDSFDLLDVIQIITMSRKSIALVVNTGLEEQGILRFQMGELIWAEYGILRGEEAFFALAAHKNGTVVHRPWNDQITPNVTQPLSRLIFQALQYRSKYAESQQLSGDMEAIRPGGAAPSAPLLPSTEFPEALQDLEDDDRPFQFVAEDGLVEEQAPAGMLPPGGLINSRPEGVGVVKNTESGVKNMSKEKAWWEPTGSFPGIQMSGGMRVVTGEETGKPSSANGVNITPSTVHKTMMGQNNALPSWLTDQPTHSDLPVLRGNTGQMSIAPRERSPVLPKTPPTSGLSALPQNGNAEWPVLPQPPALGLSKSGLRKIKAEESLFTDPHRAVKPNDNQPGRPLRSAPAEWQSPMPASLNGQTGPMSPIKPPGGAERSENPLQSLASLKKTGATPAPEPLVGKTGTPPSQPIKAAEGRTWSAPGTGKRNYPALAAALQTLGYSVPGFIASAVVSLDGTPIAQVAVDEMDISPLCGHFSGIIQGALQALEQGHGEMYEHTVITSRARHILLRIPGKKKDVFQVLITTRETNPAESLEIMASVEAAIAAAL